MPTVIIRPNSTSSAGNWSVADANIPGQINDQSDVSFVINNSANQDFTVNLDDVSLSGATFNSFTVTVRAKVSGKGSSEWNTRLLDTVGSSILSSTNSSTSSSSFSDIASGSGSFSAGFSETAVNGLQVRVLTLNNTQCVIAELFITIDYTAGSSGYGHDVNSLASTNIGKVNAVATANIGKVNSVD